MESNLIDIAVNHIGDKIRFDTKKGKVSEISGVS